MLGWHCLCGALDLDGGGELILRKTAQPRSSFNGPEATVCDPTRVCVQITGDAFKFFNNYMSSLKNVTNVTQPLTKFDFVAVPGKSGAMEVRWA